MTEPTIPSWSSIKKHYLDTGSVTMPVYKALTDYKEVLTPILMKIRDGEPLSPQEEETVQDCFYHEMDNYLDSGDRGRAFEEGRNYIIEALEAGADYNDLCKEVDNYADARYKQNVMDREHPAHNYQMHSNSTPEDKLRLAIRAFSDNMGTDAQANRADGIKLRGMESVFEDNTPDFDSDDEDSLDSDDGHDYEGGE